MRPTQQEMGAKAAVVNGKRVVDSSQGFEEVQTREFYAVSTKR